MRSARGWRRREEILDAALGVFVRLGYRSTSLRDIAAAAGITHPAVARYFPSKDAILEAVVERAEERNERWLSEQGMAERSGLDAVALARHNAEQPGFTALFAMLSGEAGALDHPAHERMAERYRRVFGLADASLHRAARSGGLPGGTDPSAEAVRLTAVWDGLQLLELYLPDRVDLVAELEAWCAWVGTGVLAPSHRRGGTWPETAVTGSEPVDHDLPVGYAVGRRRRDRILADASALFAERGFADTSMRTIAERVGVSKSTLFHHYPSKDDLLMAVLARRDDRSTSASSDGTARQRLRSLIATVRGDTATEPGLVELSTVLVAEAAVSSHPAHPFFVDRYRDRLGRLGRLFAELADDGSLHPDLPPAQQALWTVALWDGLQVQWLYHPDLVDVADLLDSYVDTVLIGDRTEDR